MEVSDFNLLSCETSSVCERLNKFDLMIGNIVHCSVMDFGKTYVFYSLPTAAPAQNRWMIKH